MRSGSFAEGCSRWALCKRASPVRGGAAPPVLRGGHPRQGGARCRKAGNADPHVLPIDVSCPSTQLRHPARAAEPGHGHTSRESVYPRAGPVGTDAHGRVSSRSEAARDGAGWIGPTDPLEGTKISLSGSRPVKWRRRPALLDRHVHGEACTRAAVDGSHAPSASRSAPSARGHTLRFASGEEYAKGQVRSSGKVEREPPVMPAPELARQLPHVQRIVWKLNSKLIIGT